MARPVLRPLSLLAGTLVLLPVAVFGAAQQIFSATTGRVQNVSFQQLGAGVIEVRYDLVAESPAARFTINVRVSQDGGRTFTVLARSVSGDITNVAPGPNRRIVWHSGADVEALFIDQLQFEVRATAGPGRAVATLNVRSNPEGAAVMVDGRDLGTTPLTVRNLAPGRHELRLTRAGFLENTHEVTLGPGESRDVSVPLTALGSDAPKTSGRKKWIVPAVAGGALAALLPLRGSKPVPETFNQPPTVSSISILQPGDGGIGLQAATIFRFGATTADAENDAVSLTWTFGDGSVSATGSEVTHVYDSSGTFTVRLTAQDAKGATTSTERTVQVRSMTGRWSGTITAGGQSIGFTLQLTQQQAGSAITGSYSDSKGAGSVARSGISDTRAVSLTIGQGNLTIDLSCRLDVSGNRCDGTTGNAYSGTLTMSRQ